MLYIEIGLLYCTLPITIQFPCRYPNIKSNYNNSNYTIIFNVGNFSNNGLIRVHRLRPCNYNYCNIITILPLIMIYPYKKVIIVTITSAAQLIKLN